MVVVAAEVVVVDVAAAGSDVSVEEVEVVVDVAVDKVAADVVVVVSVPGAAGNGCDSTT